MAATGGAEDEDSMEDMVELIEVTKEEERGDEEKVEDGASVVVVGCGKTTEVEITGNGIDEEGSSTYVQLSRESGEWGVMFCNKKKKVSAETIKEILEMSTKSKFTGNHSG